MAAPRYLTLREWGGTPNGWPAMTLPAVAVQVHHSVTNEHIGVPATDFAKADFRELDAIGLARGHGGISYSFAIHPSGTIGEGQGDRRGAHTAGDGCGGSPWGWNPCTYGVVFVGNFDDDTPTPEAINSFRWLIAVLRYTGKLAPGAVIRGHRDAPGNPTACPGANLEAALPELRKPYTDDAQEDDVRGLLIRQAGTPYVWFFVNGVRIATTSATHCDLIAFFGQSVNSRDNVAELSAEQMAAIPILNVR